MGFRTDTDLNLNDVRVIEASGFKKDALTSDETQAQALAYQRRLTEELGHFYEFSDESTGIPCDPHLAKKFKGIPEENTDKNILPADWFASLRLQVSQAVKSRLKSAVAYEWLGWFTWFRLLMLRAVRFKKILEQAISPAVTFFTTYGGLSYFIELGVDGVMVIKSTFMPSDEVRERNPHWYNRFVSVLNKDERPLRMLNAFAWGMVNLICLYVTGGASAILNLSLFGFDVCVDAYKTYRDNKKHGSVLEKLTNKMGVLRTEINALEERHYKYTDVSGETSQQLRTKYAELNKYRYIKSQIQAQQKTVNNNRLYLLGITCLIFVGMVCVFFPPAPLVAVASVTAIKLMGAAFALAGSVFGGRGRRVYRASKAKLDELYDAAKEKVVEIYDKDTKRPEDMEEKKQLAPKAVQVSNPASSPIHALLFIPPETPAPVIDKIPSLPAIEPPSVRKMIEQPSSPLAAYTLFSSKHSDTSSLASENNHYTQLGNSAV